MSGSSNLTFSNYVKIRDVVQKTCQRRWTIGKSGERGSGISVLPARHDDDDDYYYYSFKSFSHQRKLMDSIGVCVIENFLKSPGLLSVFKPILIILQSGWSLFFLLVPSLPFPFTNGDYSERSIYNWYYYFTPLRISNISVSKQAPLEFGRP